MRKPNYWESWNSVFLGLEIVTLSFRASAWLRVSKTDHMQTPLTSLGIAFNVTVRSASPWHLPCQVQITICPQVSVWLMLTIPALLHSHRKFWVWPCLQPLTSWISCETTWQQKQVFWGKRTLQGWARSTNSFSELYLKSLAKNHLSDHIEWLDGIVN